MTLTEVWVNKSDYRQTRKVEASLPQIDDGEILVVIDKFALTSNNVGYAMSGDMIGYWKYFPTGEEEWGKVTVWGMADVVESNCAEIAVGERLYGFFPMSSHQRLTPGNVKRASFTDVTDHRTVLPALYNHYARCQTEPAFLQELEDERSVLFPLFLTGFVIADFLQDNSWFDAEQIIVGSVSSKTGIGTAAFIKENGFKGKLIGLTSSSNREFVEGLDLCDQVVTYDELDALDQVASVYIDMSGDAGVRFALHAHLEDHMKSSQIVGATHWDQSDMKKAVPGIQPVFFFTPGQIDKRNADWGPGVLMQNGYEASAKLAFSLKGQLAMERHKGADKVASLWLDMLENKVSGQRGLMLSVKE